MMKNFLFFFCFLIKLSVCEQSGSLDLSFGIGGKVTTDIGTTYDRGNSVAIQSDGEIIVAGWSQNGFNDDFALVRYNSNGTLDNNFGSGGEILTDFGSGRDRAYAVTIQSDSKIVVVGNTYTSSYVYDFAIARYNSNGTLDTTFGFNGKVLADFGNTNDFGYSVVIQSDGKIVVVGSSYNHIQWSFALARYESNGNLDYSFGTGGKVTSEFGSFDEVGSVLIQSDGKIVLAGCRYDNGSWRNFALVRFNINGNLDWTFGAGGKVVTDFAGESDTGNSVAIQSDGKIIVAGWSINPGISFALARYENNGMLDNTFGIGGKVKTPIGGGSQGNSVIIQSDGKIIVAGDNNNGLDRDFALVRYNIDGTLDNTFGSGGKVTTDFGGADDWGFSVAIQNDCKIVVAGYSHNGSNWSIAVARYENTFFTGIGTQTNVLCSSECTGVANVIVNGGQPPYSYLWAPGGETTATVTDMCAGTYTYTVTDSIGSTTTSIITITQPTPLLLSETHTNLCSAQCTGTVILTASGGKPPYTFNGLTSGLCASIYTYSVTDANGCTATTTATITQAIEIIVSVTAENTSTFINSTTNLLTGTPAGGIFSGAGVSGTNFNSSVAGLGTWPITYTYTDENGCTESATINIIVDMSTRIAMSGGEEARLEIYPNPTSGIFIINLKNKTAETKICVYDVLGKCVFDKVSKNDKEKIDLSGKPKGGYTLEIESGGKSDMKKIVLQ